MHNLVNRNISLAAASLGPNAWLWLVQAPSIAKRTLGVLLVVLATGCGGGGDTGSGETSPTNPNAQPATIRAVGFNTQAPVNLASAEAYAICSGATISHVPSNISGDVGVSRQVGLWI